MSKSSVPVGGRGQLFALNVRMDIYFEGLIFLLIGLFTGWAVSLLLEKRGLGIWGDGITGLSGALAGGGVFKIFATTENRLWGAVGVAAFGAMLFQFLLGYFP